MFTIIAIYASISIICFAILGLYHQTVSGIVVRIHNASNYYSVKLSFIALLLFSPIVLLAALILNIVVNHLDKITIYRKVPSFLASSSDKIKDEWLEN